MPPAAAPIVITASSTLIPLRRFLGGDAAVISVAAPSEPPELSRLIEEAVSAVTGCVGSTAVANSSIVAYLSFGSLASALCRAWIRWPGASRLSPCKSGGGSKMCL